MARHGAGKLLVGVLVFYFSGALFLQTPFTQLAQAANANLNPNGDGATGAWTSTAATFHTEINDGVTQPTVPNLTDSITADAATGGNYFTRIETVASDISLVTRIRVRVYHNDGSNGRVNVQLFDDDETTALSGEIRINRNNSSNGWDTANFTGLAITPAQLDSLSVRLRPSLHNGGNPSNDVIVHAVYVQTTYNLDHRFRQAGFRFFGNLNSTDVGAPLSAQNVGIDLTGGDEFRLRVLIDLTRSPLPLDSQSFKLQFVDRGSGSCSAPSGGTPAVYTDVTSGTIIAFNDNPGPADEDGLTVNVNDPVHDSDVTENQSYQESNNFSNSESAVPNTESALWDFSLIDNGATTGSQYCVRIVEDDGTELFSYDEYPTITAPGGALTFDIVNASGATVANPNRNLTVRNFSFDCQTAEAQIGVNGQRLRVTNTTASPQWSLSIAPTDGPTATWSDGGSNQYDFNDPSGSPAGCSDGVDADSWAGQLFFDLDAVNRSPEAGCSNTGVTGGTSAAYSEGVIDSITLVNASAAADTNCYWDFRNMDIVQTIPGEQTEASYNLNLTITVTAI